MEHLFTNILLALGVATTPVPEWKAFGASPGLLVEVDANSMKVQYRQGWELYS